MVGAIAGLPPAGGARIKAYKLFFHKVDEFLKLASEVSRYRILFRPSLFFDFLCKEYKPQYEDARAVLQPYTAEKYEDDLDRFIKARAVRKGTSRSITTLMMYGSETLGANVLDRLNSEVTDAWPVDDFESWEVPLISETGTNSNTITTRKSQQKKETSHTARSDAEDLAPRGEKRKMDDQIAIPQDIENLESPGKRRKVDDQVTTARDAEHLGPRGKKRTLDEQIAITEDAEPLESRGRGKKRKMDDQITTTKDAAEEPGTTNVPPTLIKAQTENHDTVREHLPPSEIARKMEDLYMSIQQACLQYFKLTSAEMTDIIPFSELKDTTPELHDAWVAVFGWDPQQEGLSSAEMENMWEPYSTDLAAFAIMQSLIGSYITNAIFLGQGDLSQWEVYTGEIGNRFEEARVALTSAFASTLEGKDMIAEIIVSRLSEHVKDIGWMSNACLGSSLMLKCPKAKSFTKLANELARPIMKVIEPHISLLYQDPPGKLTPWKPTLLATFTGRLESVIHESLKLSQHFDTRNEPYLFTWFRQGEPYDPLAMETMGPQPIVREGPCEVEICTLPAVSVYDSEVGHIFIYRAKVHVRKPGSST